MYLSVPVQLSLSISLHGLINAYLDGQYSWIVAATCELHVGYAGEAKKTEVEISRRRLVGGVGGNTFAPCAHFTRMHGNMEQMRIG